MNSDIAMSKTGPQKDILLTEILNLLDLAAEGCLELLAQFSNGNTGAALTLLEDLRSAASAVRSAREPIASALEHSFTEEMLDNVDDTLESIAREMDGEDWDRAVTLMEFQLFPFLRQLREAFYFWGDIYPDGEKTKRYYADEFADHFRNPYIGEGEPAKYQLSIVVAAYNHLDTTKQCVESILRETDFQKLNVELILIDHGSTDDTLAYFKGLNVKKVIHFKRNVRMYMFTLLTQICEGEYLAFVSNDIIVTKNWASILLQCLQSDETIIAAVPATPNVANLQMTTVPASDPAQFVTWANGQNRSDASRWNDRARLMPPVGMYRVSLLNQVGLADPYFYSMEFWDDDFSLRARRAGCRQIVCDDVACYHFGSKTGREAQKQESTLEYGRVLFQNKNGVDAWGKGFCYDITAVRLMLDRAVPQGTPSILGIDCGMGDTPLQIRNELRHRHQACEIYNLTYQEAYAPDLEPLSDGFALAPGRELSHYLGSAFSGQSFHYVYIGEDIGHYPDAFSLLQAVERRMSRGGILILTCENPYFAPTMHALIQFSMPSAASSLALLDPEQLHRKLSQLFSDVQVTGARIEINGLEKFIQTHYGKQGLRPELREKLSVQKYYFICVKA